MLDSIEFVPRTEIEAMLGKLETRLKAVEVASATMATAQTTLQETLTSNTHKLDHILDFLNHANSAWGFMRKHGPKVGYLCLGIAVSRGWITAENGKNFLHIFTG